MSDDATTHGLTNLRDMAMKDSTSVHRVLGEQITVEERNPGQERTGKDSCKRHRDPMDIGHKKFSPKSLFKFVPKHRLSRAKISFRMVSTTEVSSGRKILPPDCIPRLDVNQPAFAELDTLKALPSADCKVANP